MRQRCADLVAVWDLTDASAGYYAFNDVHALLAMLAANDGARAEHWVARCAARALAADDAPRSNHAMAREVGAPLMRALLALARGEPVTAAQALYAVRGEAQRSVAARAARPDRPDAAGGGRRAAPLPLAGRAVLNERRSARDR